VLNGTLTSPVVTVGQGSNSAALMVNVQLVAVAPVASITLMVKLPDAVGVPLTRPVPLSIRPDKLPVPTEYVKGATPPVGDNWLLKAVPTSAVVTLGHGSASALLIVNVQLVAVAPVESITLIVNVPAAVGVPLTRPVLLSVRPNRLPEASE
jgi:hypothetical protein